MFGTINLTPEERAVLEVRLKEAKEAFHQLATGTMARVVVDQNGERVEFAAANKGNLYNYILALQAQLGVTPAALSVVRPAGFLF